MEKDQHTEIMVALGKLEAGQISTNQHLVQLNSKVATHEGRLNAKDVEDGKLQGIIEALKNTDNKDAMTKNKWMERGIALALNAFIFLAVLLLVRSGILNLEREPQTLEEAQKQIIDAAAEAQKLQIKQQ